MLGAVFGADRCLDILTKHWAFHLAVLGPPTLRNPRRAAGCRDRGALAMIFLAPGQTGSPPALADPRQHRGDALCRGLLEERGRVFPPGRSPTPFSGHGGHSVKQDSSFRPGISPENVDCAHFEGKRAAVVFR